jgi:hypothetical protein
VLGETGDALTWLRDTAENGYPCPTFFALDPLLERLRGQPDFQRLMRGLEGDRDRYAQLYHESVRASRP